MNTIQIEYPGNLDDYALLDSGEGEKLERFGNYIIIRPDPRAIWGRSENQKQWKQADAVYQRNGSDSGQWIINTPPPTPWLFHFDSCKFTMRPTDFKHVGIFPEQTVNWRWLKTIITKPLSILNLFAYTGGASVMAASYGAHVTHVDSSKSTITWANQNFSQNNIPKEHIRWIEDDAVAFVMREAKRGKTYDGIIMDPPKFGRGSKGQVWKFEDDLPKLLTLCKKILSPNPSFFLINAYTVDVSSIALGRILETTMDGVGTIQFGELATREEPSKRLLPQGIFARWQK